MGKPKMKLDTKHESNDAARAIGKRKKFTSHDLCSFKAKSANQQKFIDMYLEGRQMIALTGLPGTGKTYMACWMALSEVLEPGNGFYKVVIIRSAVESRKQGYLPGELDGPNSKNAPYEAPFRQVCRKIIPDFEEAYDHMKAMGVVEFHTTGWLRGQGFDNTILVLDETQNLDWDEIYTVITRLGENSKIIIMGDEGQDDLKRQRQTSGLAQLRRVMKNMSKETCGEVQFGIEDIQRSGLIKDFIIACSKTN